MKMFGLFCDVVVVFILALSLLVMDWGLVIRYHGLKMIGKDPGPYYRIGDISDH